VEHTPLGGTPPNRPPRRYARLAASVGAAATLAAVLAPSAASAGATDQAGMAAAATAVPAGFLPSSTSWTSPTSGWVLGFAPCPAGTCPVLVRTSDGGQTWQQRTAPQVAQTVDQTRVQFAPDGRNGWATDGETLVATHDGAATWSRVRLPGTVGSVAVSKLAAADAYAYAVVTSGVTGATTTRLYSSPVGEDGWQPVPGVSVPGSGGWDVATRGSAAYVALGVVHESLRMWSTADGGAWTEVQPLCSVDDAVRLSLPSAGTVQAMCSFAPGRGFMTKLLVESVDGGAPVVLGQAPSEGITTAFATASDRRAFVAGVGAGATWLHATFTHGVTWETPLVLPDLQLPLGDLQFQDSRRGVAVWGGPSWSAAAVYRTTDGGRTWTPLTL
jgi:photosystem II stability/assembly factor-like uncharacterized protein